MATSCRESAGWRTSAPRPGRSTPWNSRPIVRDRDVDREAVRQGGRRECRGAVRPSSAGGVSDYCVRSTPGLKVALASSASSRIRGHLDGWAVRDAFEAVCRDTSRREAFRTRYKGHS